MAAYNVPEDIPEVVVAAAADEDTTFMQTVSGCAASGGDGTTVGRRSPALQLSEVEEILEHSAAMVPRSQCDPDGEESSAVFVGSSDTSERDANETSSATATEEEDEEGDSSDTMTESQGDADDGGGGSSRRFSLTKGFWSCLSPVVTSFWKGRDKNNSESVTLEGDEFEIAFADIKELEFIGSGAQGAVFRGEYRGEKVAVKKVRDKSYCNEICQLRKLSHRTIVQLRYIIAKHNNNYTKYV